MSNLKSHFSQDKFYTTYSISVHFLNTVGNMIIISALLSPFNLFKQFCRILPLNSHISCTIPPVWSVLYRTDY